MTYVQQIIITCTIGDFGMTKDTEKKAHRRRPVGAIDAPDEHQILRMIKACKERKKEKHEILIKFGWMTALRLHALTNIKVGYINFMEHQVKVPSELQKDTRRTKKEDRFIVLNELEYINDIDNYVSKWNLESDDYLFNHGDNRSKYCVRRIAGMIEEVGNWIGYKHLRPHLLRHSRAKYLLKEGYSTKWVQDLLLHEDAATTLNQYSRFSLKELHEQGMAGSHISGKKKID
jgi:integrase